MYTAQTFAAAEEDGIECGLAVSEIGVMYQSVRAMFPLSHLIATLRLTAHLRCN